MRQVPRICGPRRKQILVVDDQEELWSVIRQAFREDDWDFRFFPSAESALEGIGESYDALDAALLDIALPGMGGIDLLKAVHALDLDLPVLMLTGQMSPSCVVQCMRAGAYDYITKPFLNADLRNRLRRAVETRGLTRRVARLESEDYLAPLMGPSRAVSDLGLLIARVGATEMSVLIEGESGTGKELAARRIHALSPRNGGPFVAVDCGAIPENLLESEFFGSRKGSFTGASGDRVGKFGAAHGGTLLLDEVENLPIAMQHKLLRALQEKQVTPIGANRPVPFDVRILSASNRPVLPMVTSGAFRLDLYHRIAEFPVVIPPIRERAEDLTYLVVRFLREACEEFHKKVSGFSEAAWEQLLTHPWPGNVRELRSVIRRATLLAEGRVERVFLDSGPSQLPACASVHTVEGNTIVQAIAVIGNASLREGHFSFKATLRRLTDEIEHCILSRILEHAGGNKSLAARILDLDYKTLHEKAKHYGIQIERNGHHEQAETV